MLFCLLALLITPLVLFAPSASASAAPAKLARADVAPAHIESASARLFRADASRVGVSPPRLLAEWQKVATCEVGGNWSMTGSEYSGIGFLNTTWDAYGGDQFAPLAGHASALQQIIIGMRVTRGWVPDQYGCSPGGW
jgi:hypothetical protein